MLRFLIKARKRRTVNTTVSMTVEIYITNLSLVSLKLTETRTFFSNFKAFYYFAHLALSRNQFIA